MAEVDKDKIEKYAKEISINIQELEKSVDSTKTAFKEINDKMVEAMKLDGQTLSDTYLKYDYTYQGDMAHNYEAKVTQTSQTSFTRGLDTLYSFIRQDIASLKDFVETEVPNSLKNIGNKVDETEEALDDPSNPSDPGGGGGGGGGGGSSKKTSPEEYFKETKLESNAANFPTTPNPANTATTPEDPRQGSNEPTFDNTHTYSNTSTTNNSQNPSSTTSSDDPKPSATVPTGGASGSGGGSAAGTHHTYYEPTEADENSSSLINDDGTIKTTTEDQDKDALADSLINRGISRVIPKSNGNKTVQRGSAVIPIASGLTAAAAAGLGGKAFLDRTSNNDSDEDDNESDIEKNNYNDDHQELEEVNNSKNEDKSWLYGMGVGLSTVGSGGNSNQDDDELEE